VSSINKRGRLKSQRTKARPKIRERARYSIIAELIENISDPDSSHRGITYRSIAERRGKRERRTGGARSLPGKTPSRGLELPVPLCSRYLQTN
jgi:hypothetical protein